MRRTTPRVSILAKPGKGFAAKVMVGALLACALTLVGAAKMRPELMGQAQHAAMDASARVMDAAAYPVRLWHQVADNVANLASLREQNAVLKAKAEKLSETQVALRALQFENKKLREITNFAPLSAYRHITARVALHREGPDRRTITLYAGTAHGIAPDAAVITPQGVIGRVVEVAERSARVLLLTDIHSRIPVVLERGRERAIAVGDNRDGMTLEYLPEDTKISLGDRVITAADGNLVPPGLMVGTVDFIGNGSVHLSPAADFSRMDYVGVAIMDMP